MAGQGGMIYIGEVTRVGTKKVYVQIDSLGGEHAFGPLNIIVPILIDPTVQSTTVTDSVSGTTGSESVGDHGGHSHSFSATSSGHSHITNVGDALVDYFQKGDRVVVAQIGHVKEDLVVLGRLM
jgi:hypothetical protein